MPSINLISSSFHANPAFFPWKGPPSRPVQSIHATSTSLRQSENIPLERWELADFG